MYGLCFLVVQTLKWYSMSTKHFTTLSPHSPPYIDSVCCIQLKAFILFNSCLHILNSIRPLSCINFCQMIFLTLIFTKAFTSYFFLFFIYSCSTHFTWMPFSQFLAYHSSWLFENSSLSLLYHSGFFFFLYWWSERKNYSSCLKP